jgi:cell division protein FtsW
MDADNHDLDRFSRYLFLTLSALILLGVTMVYSSSYILAKEMYDNSAYYFYRQVIYLVISLVLFFIISKTKISFWLKYAQLINALAIIGLMLTFIPSFGNTVKGASRWFTFGGVGVQPGEFVKYTIALASVRVFESFYDWDVKERTLNLVGLLLPLLLLINQPDFGTFTICFIIMATSCFYSNFPRKPFYLSLISGILIGIPILISQEYRVRRLFAFLDPWKNARTSGFQVIQSYLAFANGSWFGQGLGNSNEKLFYLPESHNDFIFSVIGEELGFMGVFLVVSLFVVLLYVGFRLALFLTSRKSFILVSTVFFAIGVQVFLNMGVVLGLLPTKGLNLPFISSGGSSLIANFFALGLVMSAVNDEKKKIVKNDISTYNDHSSFDSFASNQSNLYSQNL